MKVQCPMPKCKAVARFVHHMGDVDWYVCMICRFQFPAETRKRPR